MCKRGIIFKYGLREQKLNERFNRIEKNIDDLIEIVGVIKDNMATKADLREGLDQVREELGGKIDGIHRWMETEVEERKKLEDRVSKVEEVVHL